MDEASSAPPRLVRCPECGSTNPLLAAITENVLAVTGELSLGAVLERLVHGARTLVGASYGAIAASRDGTGITDLITTGMEDLGLAHGFARLGDGAVARLARLTEPYRTANVHEDVELADTTDIPEVIRSLLVIPIMAKGRTTGAFFLGNENTWGFSQAHQDLIESLAPHAAIAIENAGLYERSRELSVVEERNRLARELHDSVAQTLFSFSLCCESAMTLMDLDPEGARAQIKELQALARDAAKEMRALVFELRPAELEAEGLVETLRKHIDVLQRVYGITMVLEVAGRGVLSPEFEREVFRIVQEAINNCIKHADASRVTVRLRIGDGIDATIHDDGLGFDPGSPVPGRHLGLTSMRERAAALGGRLTVDAAPGRGTRIRLRAGDV